MMWCVIGMVEKTRQAINTLRNKHYSELEAWKSTMKNSDGNGTALSTSGGVTSMLAKPTSNVRALNRID